MIRISLRDDDLRRLGGVSRDAAEPALRHRAQIVLMAHRGRRHPDIAADADTSPRSVQRWLNADRDRGLDGLRPRRANGATPKVTADVATVLKRWVIDGPAEHGLDRANWTYAELADHRLKNRRLRVGESALHAFGAKHGIRPYRPTYRVLRGDPAKPAVAREEIADVKSGRRPATSFC